MKASPILLIPLLTSCALLVPSAFHPKTNNQRAAVIENDSVTVYVEHIGVKHGHLILDLEVINHSSHTIFMSSQSISFYASLQPFPLITKATPNIHEVSAPNSFLTLKRHFASSPSDIEAMYEQKMRAKATAGAILTLLSVAIAVYDVAKDYDDARKETWTKQDANRAATRDALFVTTRITGDAVHQSLQSDAQDHYYLGNEMFSEGNIEPGNSARGKVFLKDDNTYSYYRIVVTVGHSDFVFDFRRRGAKRS